MMEHTTDRLFWTLTSVIVGALLLTIGIKAFPQMAQNVLQPVSGIMKQADTANGHVSDAASQVLNDGTGSSTQASPANNQNMSGTTSQNDPDAQAKANAVEASTLNLVVTPNGANSIVTPNGDGTGVLTGPANGQLSGTLNIPEYVKINGQLTKITSIGNNAFYGNNLTSVNIPNSITSIGYEAFANNNIENIVIPDSVQTIGDSAFYNNPSSSITLGKNVQTIGIKSFYNTNTQTINVPASTQSIGDQAFYGTNAQHLNLANPNTKQGQSVIDITGPTSNYTFNYSY